MCISSKECIIILCCVEGIAFNVHDPFSIGVDMEKRTWRNVLLFVLKSTVEIVKILLLRKKRSATCLGYGILSNGRPCPGCDDCTGKNKKYPFHMTY